ncbi:MAG: hypothetical protein ACK415_11510 [Thermodesulfovibrionales bacterium]
MARFIGNLRAIKIEADRKVQLTYDIQVNQKTRQELCSLIHEIQEGMYLCIYNPLEQGRVNLFVLPKYLKIELDKAQLTIDFMITTATEEHSLFDIILMQSSNLVFELSQTNPQTIKEEAA